MAEYIDREELLKLLEKKHYNLIRNHGVWDAYAYGFDAAMAVVSKFPVTIITERENDNGTH